MENIKGQRSVKTVKNLIMTAFEPVGKVMYIYGGGWNERDDGGGTEARSLGISDNWVKFAKNKDKNYNYKDYDYKKDISVIHLGLDCSAYVGWVIYNVFNDGRDYVTISNKMGDMLTKKGLGCITENEIKAGDIMFSSCNCCRHVFISLGKCADGSMLIIHSSPPGVQLSGTYTPLGNKNSLAVNLAEHYMKKYYGEWYAKYPKNSRDEKYLSHYSCFHWQVLSDDEEYTNMTPQEILSNIFDE